MSASTHPAPTSSRPVERDTRLDVLKGVLIVGVLVGHFVEASGRAVDGVGSGWDLAPQNVVMHALYLFHMPLFVFLAGVTASRRRLGHRVAQMAGLYLVLQLVYTAMWSPEPSLLSPLFPVFALWFLVAMAWWLASLPLVHRLGRAALPVSIAVALAVLLVPLEGDTAWVAWARTATFWPFFVAGHLYGWTVLRRLGALGRLAAVPAAAVLVAVTSVAVLRGLDQRWYRGTETAVSMDVSVPEGMALRLAFGALAVLCAAALVVLVPRRQPLLEALGRRSLAIYVLHPPFVIAARAVFDDAHLGAWTAFLVSVAMALSCTALLAHPVVDREVRRLAGWVADVLTLSRPGRA